MILPIDIGILYKETIFFGSFCKFNIEFDKKTKFILDLLLFVDATVTIDPKLPTKSNINWEVVNNMLERFNLQPIALNPFQRQLKSLLRIRNSVAHGENSIPIHQNMVDEQVNNVVNLMDELMFIILDGCRNFSYKK